LRGATGHIYGSRREPGGRVILPATPDRRKASMPVTIIAKPRSPSVALLGAVSLNPVEDLQHATEIAAPEFRRPVLG